jgi:mRNA-degrading endonuclease RelE of RelBE toxin-antitoxin system
MKIEAYKGFKKRYQKLPVAIQDKIDRQVEQLSKNFKHPSLQNP